MSEWHISNKRLRIDHLIHMSDEPRCIDELMDSACDCMDLCRDRSLDIDTERIMIDKALSERHVARLEKLIARVQARLQKFDAASVGASSVSPEQIEPETSSSVAESQNRIPIRNADQASLAPIPAGPEYHVAPKTKRGPKPKLQILVTTAGVSSPRSLS
jgi:hypothetical protein